MNKKEEQAVLLCALLAPMLRLVPGESARYAQAGGWLAPLLACPLLLATVLLVNRILPEGAGRGLFPLYRKAFGRGVGRLVSNLTLVWLLLTAAYQLRSCSERFVASIYPDTDIWLFLLGIAGAGWWVSEQGPAVLGRMSRVFLGVLLFIAGLILLLGAPEGRLYHIFPFWLAGGRGIAASAVPVAALLGCVLPILLLQEGRGKASCLLGLGVLTSGLGLVITGMFGWKTAARLQNPFFSAAREVSLFQIVERTEILASAVWVFSDLTFFALLLYGAKRLLPEGSGKWGGVRNALSALFCVLCAWAMGSNTFALRALWHSWGTGGSILVFYLLPLSACGAICLRERKQPQDLGAE